MKIVLISCTGERFEVEATKVATVLYFEDGLRQIEMMKKSLSVEIPKVFPLRIHRDVLRLVVDYLNNDDGDDTAFLEGVDAFYLLWLLEVSYDLKIFGLPKLIKQFISAKMIDNKNYFTPMEVDYFRLCESDGDIPLLPMDKLPSSDFTMTMFEPRKIKGIRSSMEIKEEEEWQPSKKNKNESQEYNPLPRVFKNITLRSFDGNIFEVDEAMAMQSQTIKDLILKQQQEEEEEEEGEDEEGIVSDYSTIPLDVTGNILALIIKYCKNHVDVDGKNAMDFDAKFLKEANKDILYELLIASKYLRIDALLKLTCKTVSDKLIKDKSPEEIRRTLNIAKDFDPKEYEEIHKELSLSSECF